MSARKVVAKKKLAKKKTTARRGRPARKFPSAERAQVEAMSGYGIPQEDIAMVLGCAPKTLREHCRHELDRGGIKATAKVAESLYQHATTGGSVAAAIFWMKARANWTEKHEFSGPDGGPINLNVTFRD